MKNFTRKNWPLLFGLITTVILWIFVVYQLLTTAGAGLILGFIVLLLLFVDER